MNRISRRMALMTGAAFVAHAAGPASALSDAQARALVQQVVDDINRVINSGKSERAMYTDFERIFRRYGDVGVIAASVLGPDRRRASQAQQRAFADAFAGYMARKYGKRFREFIGGRIDVQGTRNAGRYQEVQTVARLQGSSPFSVVFRVSDRSGQDRFFDIVIEGISLGKTERTEIGALLDRNRGNIDAMIADLRQRG
ncbi:MAG: ABC transporter substrate-binding protein [Pseudomonadota bacterium]